MLRAKKVIISILISFFSSNLLPICHCFPGDFNACSTVCFKKIFQSSIQFSLSFFFKLVTDPSLLGRFQRSAHTVFFSFVKLALSRRTYLYYAVKNSIFFGFLGLSKVILPSPESLGYLDWGNLIRYFLLCENLGSISISLPFQSIKRMPFLSKALF